MKPSVRTALAAVLLAVGFALWWFPAKHAGLDWRGLAWITVAALVAVIPATREAVAAALDRLRAPSPRLRARGG
ncbi:MAG: hypothetical protein QOF78_2537, partial [Phycisphaerales bacterium]|nr:hypothetical protein [Phycisphaerales bacterium]